MKWPRPQCDDCAARQWRRFHRESAQPCNQARHRRWRRCHGRQARRYLHHSSSRVSRPCSS